MHNLCFTLRNKETRNQPASLSVPQYLAGNRPHRTPGLGRRKYRKAQPIATTIRLHNCFELH